MEKNEDIKELFIDILDKTLEDYLIRIKYIAVEASGFESYISDDDAEELLFKYLKGVKHHE